MHAHLSEPGSAHGVEERKIFSALLRDGFGGFVSLEHCSGKGEPQAAVTDGIAMLQTWSRDA
jgi:sugar phosphate isomerase/epimerase